MRLLNIQIPQNRLVLFLCKELHFKDNRKVHLHDEGFLFLYNRQHEQQKHDTKVIIIIAADAPTNTPIKTVKLEQINKQYYNHKNGTLKTKYDIIDNHNYL